MTDRDADKREKHITKALRDKGFRMTSQRAEIIRILCHDTTHPTTGTILKKAREVVPKMSFSTVYYTLALLKKEQLVKEIEFYDMDNRYDSELADHIDLICAECGNITNFAEDLPMTRKLIEKKTGFEVHRTRFEYLGRCKKCKGKKD
jgi:Fur family transcriptional regulator, peroxide stress response regulator